MVLHLLDNKTRAEKDNAGVIEGKKAAIIFVANKREIVFHEKGMTRGLGILTAP